MAKTVGIVEVFSTKDVTTKFGVKPVYSLKVNGGWVKCGFKRPPCNEGDEVEFDAVTGPYGVEATGLIVTAKGSGGTAASPSAAPVTSNVRPSTYSGGKVFPIPALHGDRSIVRQNALARATELMVACRGGKPFDVDVDTTALIISLARRFEAYTAGDLDLAAAEAESAPEGDKTEKALKKIRAAAAVVTEAAEAAAA